MIGAEWTGERGSLTGENAFDPARFERIYYRRWHEVFRYAWLIARNHHDAEDIAAEAFRRALEAWSAGNGSRGEVMPWLLVITRRIAIDRHRRSRLFGWLPIEKTPELADDRESRAVERSEVWMWFDQLSRALPSSQREALFLRFQFDLSDGDAARVMGTSVGNFRTLVSRGLATLRAHPEVTDR
jgi:RNA polymerase sigma-70 factor (ECF subfamily)